MQPSETPSKRVPSVVGPTPDPESIKQTALLIAVMGAFIPPFMISAVNIALPAMAKDLSLDTIFVNWIPTSFLLASSVFLLPFGRLGDLWGRKKIYLQGTILFTAASAGLVLANSGAMIIFLRILQGIGCAQIFSTGAAIITSVFPPGERGRALGINVSAVYFGLSAGPFLGGILTQHFGWRSIFLFPIPLCLGVIWLVKTRLLLEWAEADDRPFDWAGCLLYACGLICLMGGVSLAPNSFGWILAGSGLLLLTGFLFWEWKTPAPLLDMRFFLANRAFTFGNLAALIHYSATYANSFFLSLYLQYAKGLTPQSAGMVLIFQPITQAIFSPVAGRLSDRWGPRYLASSGMAMTMAGLMYLSTLDRENSLTIIAVVLGIMGFGFALFSSPNINGIMNSVDRKFYGTAAGIQGTMRVLGQMASMAITMLLFSLILGATKMDAGLVPGFLKTMKIAYLLFSVLCFLGIGASLARGSRSGPPAPLEKNQ